MQTIPAKAPDPALRPLAIDLRRRARPAEMIIQGSLFVCAAFSILTTIGIVYELLRSRCCSLAKCR